MAIAVHRGYQSPQIEQLPVGLHRRLASAIDAAIDFKINASVQCMSIFDKDGWQVWADIGFANYAEVYVFTQPRMTLGEVYIFYRGEVAPIALNFRGSVTLEQSMEFERALGVNIIERKSIEGIPLGTVNGATLRKVRHPKYGNHEKVYLGLLECRL